MNKKAFAIALAISITIASAMASIIAAMIYFPIITLYTIFTILFAIAFIGITYVAYQVITNEFDIL
jgi:hypothetical protein